MDFEYNFKKGKTTDGREYILLTTRNGPHINIYRIITGKNITNIHFKKKGVFLATLNTGRVILLDDIKVGVEYQDSEDSTNELEVINFLLPPSSTIAPPRRVEHEITIPDIYLSNDCMLKQNLLKRPQKEVEEIEVIHAYKKRKE